MARHTVIDRAFLAGTGAEITGLCKIGPHRFAPSAIIETLMSDYDSLVLQSPDQVARIVM
jgi:hypothetical protein